MPYIIREGNLWCPTHSSVPVKNQRECWMEYLRQRHGVSGTWKHEEAFPRVTGNSLNLVPIGDRHQTPPKDAALILYKTFPNHDIHAGTASIVNYDITFHPVLSRLEGANILVYYTGLTMVTLPVVETLTTMGLKVIPMHFSKELKHYYCNVVGGGQIG